MAMQESFQDSYTEAPRAVLLNLVVGSSSHNPESLLQSDIQYYRRSRAKK